MQTLIQQAVSVAIPPQDLHSRRAPAQKDEQRATLRILTIPHLYLPTALPSATRFAERIRLFMGWCRPTAGQENEAYRHLMGEGIQEVQRFQKQGWCESHDFIGLTPHGGDLNGFILLRGERAKLDELRRSDDFERFSMRLNRLFVGYGVIPGVTGEGIQKVRDRSPEMFK